MPSDGVCHVRRIERIARDEAMKAVNVLNGFAGAQIALTADSSVWRNQGDETIYPRRASAENPAVIHYHRPDGDYGDPTSDDYNDFWGLHLWGDGIDPAEGTDWTAPKPFLGEDEYGRFAWIMDPDGVKIELWEQIGPATAG